MRKSAVCSAHYHPSHRVGHTVTILLSPHSCLLHVLHLLLSDAMIRVKRQRSVSWKGARSVADDQQGCTTRAPLLTPDTPVLRAHAENTRAWSGDAEFKLPVSEVRVVNGRVYCLPDVRARDMTCGSASWSTSGNHFLTPPDATPAAAPADDEIGYQSDSGNNGTDNKESANVTTFYGQRKRRLPGRGSCPMSQSAAIGTRAKVAKVGTEAGPGRPVSPADSLYAIYSTGDETDEESDSGQSQLSRFYSALAGVRHKIVQRPDRQPDNYTGDVCESLCRVAIHNGIDMSTDAVHEMIRQRKRREVAAESEMQEQEHRIRNMGFDSLAAAQPAHDHEQQSLQ